MDLGLQGNIEKFTLPEILQLIASGRKSGTLGVQQDDSIIENSWDQERVLRPGHRKEYPSPSILGARAHSSLR